MKSKSHLLLSKKVNRFLRDTSTVIWNLHKQVPGVINIYTCPEIFVRLENKNLFTKNEQAENWFPRMPHWMSVWGVSSTLEE